MIRSTTIAFGDNRLDRASDRRTDAAWLAGQRASGLWLPFWQDRPLLAGAAAAFLPWRPQWDSHPNVFLGLENVPGGNTRALFAVDMPGAEAPHLGTGAFQEMRSAALVLPARDCAIAGHAKALIDWHRRHGFCANCGTATTAQDGGYRRHCAGCGADHFPRVDPVVIMLPVFKGADGLCDQCLVGRNARFAGGLHSAFAGFIEPGETLETAVARELWEEAGLRIGAVTYQASQPWPFPSSLMLGCYAQALSQDFTVDGTEIAEARWMSKAEARARLAGEIDDGIAMPTPIAIAHHLIKDWAESL